MEQIKYWIWLAFYTWGQHKGYRHARCGKRDYCNRRKRMFRHSFKVGWWQGFDDGCEDKLEDAGA